jgi:hypothetical protein
MQKCSLCIKNVCCCTRIHKPTKTLIENTKLTALDDCCSSGVCKNDIEKQTTAPQPSSSSLLQFFRNVKGLFAAALGIEILCIAAAEIGENIGLYLFGLNIVGIPVAYAMGYALAGFTTFATILGRYNYGSKDKIDSCCCSALEQGAKRNFIPNLKTTFKNFAIGIVRMPQLHKQPNLKYILRTSMYILITAESACILTAETVDLMFYQYSLLLAVPLALLAGAFTIVAPEAYRKIKMTKAAA